MRLLKERERGRKGEKEITGPGSSADPADWVPGVLGLVRVLSLGKFSLP